MKKLVIVIVVVLLAVAGWAGATYYIGGEVERRYQAFIEENASWGPLRLENRSYQRGFLASQAETLVKMTVPQPPENPGEEPRLETVQLVLQHDIFHGPVLLGHDRGGSPFALAMIDTGLQFPDGASEFEEALQEVPELKDSFAIVTISLTGSAAGRMEVPAFSTQGEVMTIDWGGFSLNADYARGAGTLDGELEMPHIKMSMQNGEVVWQGLHSSFNLVEALPMLFVGQSESVFGGMRMLMVDHDSGEEKHLEVKEVKAISDSRYDGRLVHSNETITSDGVVADGQSYGPFAFELEVKNLNGQTLSDFQSQILDLYRTSDFYPPEQMAASLVPVYGDLAVSLLADSPELNINRLYLNTPMGEAKGSVKLNYDHPQQEAPSELGMIPMYLPFFNADADLSVDQQLVKSVLAGTVKQQLQKASVEAGQTTFDELEVEAQINQQIDLQLQAYEAQGLIVREQGAIKSQLSFSDGQLLVNGKPLPIFGPPQGVGG